MHCDERFIYSTMYVYLGFKASRWVWGGLYMLVGCTKQIIVSCIIYVFPEWLKWFFRILLFICLNFQAQRIYTQLKNSKDIDLVLMLNFFLISAWLFEQKINTWHWIMDGWQSVTVCWGWMVAGSFSCYSRNRSTHSWLEFSAYRNDQEKMHNGN